MIKKLGIKSLFPLESKDSRYENTMDLFGETNADEERQVMPQVGEDLAFEVDGSRGS